MAPAERHTPPDASLVVDYDTSDGGPRLAFHMHEDMEIGICMAGRSERHIGEASFLLAPGGVWLCGVWEPHAWLNTPGFSGLHFYVSPESMWGPFRRGVTWMRMFASPVDQRPKADTPEMREQTLAIGAEMARECRERRTGWREAGWAGLVRLLVVLERGWRPPEGSASPLPSSPAGVARILPALTLVQSDVARHVRADEAAAACDLSPSRFRTVFRHTMGISYDRYGVRARVTSAASRLLAGNAPIETVARQAGFADRSHLARVFGAFYGCSPSEFRRRNLGART